MDLPKVSGESIERDNEEDNERRMKISRTAARTMRYRRDDYNIEELSNGRYGCRLIDLIRTRGMQHLKAQEEEVWEISKWGRRHFEVAEKEEGVYNLQRPETAKRARHARKCEI